LGECALPEGGRGGCEGAYFEEFAARQHSLTVTAVRFGGK
jgi:hypothetical protein